RRAALRGQDDGQRQAAVGEQGEQEGEEGDGRCVDHVRVPSTVAAPGRESATRCSAPSRHAGRTPCGLPPFFAGPRISRPAYVRAAAAAGATGTTRPSGRRSAPRTTGRRGWDGRGPWKGSGQGEG